MPHNPDIKTDSRVYVNGNRLPMTTLDLYIRKEGPLDITRYVEGNFISPYRTDDYLQHFNTHKEDEQSDWDVLRVDIKDRSTDEYSTEFHGVVTGLGNSSGIPREWSFRAQGPGLFFDKIKASKNFTNATISDVFEYVDTRLEEKFPFELTTLGTDDRVQADEANPLATTLSKLVDYDFPRNNIMNTGKTFKANKHTLADVIEWVRDKASIRLWIEPTQNGGRLVKVRNPTANTHRAHYLDGDLRIVNNDALAELKPINTLLLRSKVSNSLGIDGVFHVKETGSEYNIAKVREPTLYERAGQTEYIAQPDTVSDANTMGELENDAKSLLKEKIDEATGGDMQTLLRAPIKPFDTVEARPTCNSSPATDTEPITYEVSRVHHEITPSGISETKLNIGLHTPLENIETVSKSTEDV